MSEAMTDTEIRSNLVEIFAAVLEIDEAAVVDELSPDTCETWDSLRHMQICTAIDECFGIALDMEKQIEILTFDLAIETVKEALSDG